MWAAGGIAPAAQRFIPEYRTLGDERGLRGFLLGSRWVSFAYGTVVALLLAAVVLTFSGAIAPYYWLPLLIGAAVIPVFPVSSVQDTISRCFNWIELGLIPNYVMSPLIICAVLAAIHAFGGTVTAVYGLMAASTARSMTLTQTALLRGGPEARGLTGRARHAFRHWMIPAAVL
jgi:O-antigen/teichoic acid export membrane protein